MREIEVLSDLVGPWAFVPTMGALHAGHQSLINRGRQLADEVILSIFINPLQFEDKDDLEKYPKTPEVDSKLAKESGATVLWRPNYQSIYPGESKKVSAGLLGEKFEGVHRPGHFDGVLTVVNRLFEIVRPTYAIFGEKDFQQLFLIKEMASKLHPDIQIISAPTIRQSNGLALSSRNSRLSSRALSSAEIISKTLNSASRERSIARAKSRLKQLESDPAFILDYAEIIDEETFQIADGSTLNKRAIVAGWIEGVRLIDNMAIESSLVRA